MQPKALYSAAIVLALAACGVTDDRPQTLAYITETILAPNCAAAECHSSMKRAYGYAFDTVENANKSIANPPIGTPLITPCATEPPCNEDTTTNYLLQVIDDRDSQGNRMPLDTALPNLDIDFITRWIAYGADGYDPTVK